MAIPLINIRHLSESDIDQMYLAFHQAFENYPVPFKLNKAEFRKKFVEKLNINFRLSAGAFFKNEMVGFIFTSVNNYLGVKSAYNGGTGVIPGFRGQQLTARLYKFLIPKFKSNSIQQCILEVLTENKNAIHTYENIGFKQSKLFHCFRLMIPNLSNPNKEVEIHPVETLNWKFYQKFFDHLPSFLDSKEMIMRNLNNEKVIEAHLGGNLAGFAIYQPIPGRISQIAIERELRRKKIGTSMINYIYHDAKNKSLTLINIGEDAKSLIGFLNKLGFENQLDQYEMILKLD